MKGVNKNVIEITDTGSDCFERVILFVRPEKWEGDGAQLGGRAQQYLSGLHMRRSMLRKFKPGWIAVKYASALAVGSAITMMLLKI